jgi:hypothetical protein
MSWTAHYFDRRLKADSLTRPYTTKEDALRLACDLMRRDCQVQFIQGPGTKGSSGRDCQMVQGSSNQ